MVSMLNVVSPPKHLDETRVLLADNSIDVLISLNETRLNSNISGGQVHITGLYQILILILLKLYDFLYQRLFVSVVSIFQLTRWPFRILIFQKKARRVSAQLPQHFRVMIFIASLKISLSLRYLVNLGLQIQQNSPKTKITISGLTFRRHNSNLPAKIKHTNASLA